MAEIYVSRKDKEEISRITHFFWEAAGRPETLSDFNAALKKMTVDLLKKSRERRLAAKQGRRQ